MHRRDFLAATIGSFAAGTLPAMAAPPGAPPPRLVTRLGTTWRGPSEDSPQQVGIFEIDWERQAMRVAAAQQVPGRGHGLMAEADGGLVAAAFRYGTWLRRLDAQGRLMRSVSTTDDPGERRIAGHVVASANGSVLLTTELDPRSGEGWIGVRDRQTLRKLDEWRCHGTEPHQLLLDADGHVVVANGSVLRTPEGRKRDLDRMASSLALLDGRNGSLRGQWRLPDSRLSLRHMAWSTLPGHDRPLLGVALQAEHDDPARRADAPLLAVRDGDTLTLPCPIGSGDGYAGDIAAADGGFVVSCQKAGQAFWWRHDKPSELALVARMQQAGALTGMPSLEGAVAIAGAKGVGRWHPAQPAMMLAWPQALALGSHWVELAPAD
jgi:hypothetical protein